MKIETFSTVVGTTACDAACPFCVSKMTGRSSAGYPRKMNTERLKRAISLARIGQCTTCLITGKGEPTLYPSDINSTVALAGDVFPFVELQTNGLQIGDIANKGKASVLDVAHLQRWRKAGLTTIALSLVGIKQEQIR